MSIIRMGEYGAGDLPPGTILTVIPVSSAFVHLVYSDETSLSNYTAILRRYGPYKQAATYTVTPIAGSTTITESTPQDDNSVTNGRN